MKFGVGASSLWYSKTSVMDSAKTAEALGFESVWLGDHIIIPRDVKNPERHGTTLPEFYRHLADPLIWLTAAAAVTNRVKPGTQICLVPQRDPLILAKQIACLDHISGGRFILGAGFGWIEEEAEIMGYPLAARWAKTSEHLHALKTIWTEETPSFDGEFVSFPPLYSYPKPVQKPHPPILIGAGIPETKDRTPILRRVVDVADGWQPAFLTPTEIAGDLEILKGLCEEKGRDFDAMDITLLVPGIRFGFGEALENMGTLDKTAKDPLELVAEYEEAGVTRIILGLARGEGESYEQQLEHVAKAVGVL